MKILRMKSPVVSSLLLLAAALPGAAASIITVDESGNGTVASGGTTTSLPSFRSTDSTNSPLVFSNVLTYGPLPSATTAGDVEVFLGATPADVIRFNSTNDLLFYAAAGRGANDNSPATQYTPPIPPGPVPNTVQLFLTSGNSLTYTPTSGQPGYDASTTPTYDFILAPGTAATPEPVSALLSLLGVVGLLGWRKLRRA